MNWYPAQRSLPLCCDKFSANFSSVYGFALGNQTTRCKQTLMPKTKLKNYRSTKIEVRNISSLPKDGGRGKMFKNGFN